jgi:lysophospholipase L1-like esterase
MRGVREYASPKPPSALRFVALGDSFTFGEGVADDATWPAQLERALTGTEVLNLGERGYAHDQMYFALLDNGIALEPDAVIVGFFENDVWRNDLTFYAYDKPRFALGREGWYIENLPVPSPQELRDRYLRLPLVYAVPRALLGSFAVRAMDVNGNAERAAEIFRRMRQLTEGVGARFLVVNLPDLFPVRSPVIVPGFFYDYCARTGAECVDPWPLFWSMAKDDPAEVRRRFLRPNDMHYSREGYAVVAEALRRHVTEHPIDRARRTTTASASSGERR